MYVGPPLGLLVRSPEQESNSLHYWLPVESWQRKGTRQEPPGRTCHYLMSILNRIRRRAELG